MGGVDAIAFTGGIGENSALIRQHIAQRFDFLGAALNEDLNNDAIVTTKSAIAEISNASSVVKLFVIAADEEVAIADSVNQKLKANESEDLKKVKIHVLRTWI
jgi:acetate kinase